AHGHRPGQDGGPQRRGRGGGRADDRRQRPQHGHRGEGLAMPKRGKKYLEALKQLEHGKNYPPAEAISLAKKTARAKFDETVELHLRTGLDPRHADQQIRGTALLPHGLGKTVRVLVFAEGEGARAAEAAGADYVGSDDLIKRIEAGWTDFDVALASRALMTKVSHLG